MRLLLVEDNRRLSGFVSEGLKQAGFETDQVYEAEEALASLDVQTYDLVVLDLGLPDLDGLHVLKKLRERNPNLPVLVLTARDSLEDRVKGLNAGADDYVLKPFEMEELLARIRALLRRPGQSLGNILRTGNVEFDTHSRETRIEGRAVRLTRRETDLLEQLLRCAGQVLAKELIESRLYSYGETGSANSIEVLLHRLRKKLEDGGANTVIHTLRGIGYLIAEQGADPDA